MFKDLFVVETQNLIIIDYKKINLHIWQNTEIIIIFLPQR